MPEFMSGYMLRRGSLEAKRFYVYKLELHSSTVAWIAGLLLQGAVANLLFIVTVALSMSAFIQNHSKLANRDSLKSLTLKSRFSKVDLWEIS